MFSKEQPTVIRDAPCTAKDPVGTYIGTERNAANVEFIAGVCAKDALRKRSSMSIELAQDSLNLQQHVYHDRCTDLKDPDQALGCLCL